MRLLVVLLLVTGCTSLEGPEYGVFDTAEDANRFSYRVTDAVDREVIAPVAREYRRVVPDWARTAIGNFFRNIRGLNSALNGYLQGNVRGGTTDLARFVLNTTVGIVGFVDVASTAGLLDQEEDLGQTLAVWGYTKSRYVFVPFFGPSTVRDLPDLLIRGLMPGFLMGDGYTYWVGGVDVLNARADGLVATDARDAGALDPYAFTREAYYQLRRFEVYNGDPPLDDFDDFFDDEDWEDEEEADVDATMDGSAAIE